MSRYIDTDALWVSCEEEMPIPIDVITHHAEVAYINSEMLGGAE